MKLIYFKTDVPNFGDELNPYIWDHLLPGGFLDADDRELFIGIGSILWDTFPKGPRKIVMGSGYGGYTSIPDTHDGSWDVVFVRGPRTAELLGLPAEKAVCDGAVLLRSVPLPAPAQGIDIAFMPHFESLDRGTWRRACKLAGIHLIDPTGPVETVLSEIQGARLLITEAMHGAIVADALRTPWVAVRPIHPMHWFKWLDWTDSLGLDHRPRPLVPSSMREVWVRVRRKSAGRVDRFLQRPIARPADAVLSQLAAARLSQLAKADPQLSRDSAITGASDRAAELLHGFLARRSADGLPSRAAAPGGLR